MSKTVRKCLIEERKRRCWSQQELADRLGTTPNNIGRWELGKTTPNSYFRVKLCEIFNKSAQELGLLSTQIREDRQSEGVPALPAVQVAAHLDLSLWHVPYLRNLFFTGRGEVLDHLHTVLHQQHALTITQSLAISGLGGIGKTQIALEYAYRYRKEYRFIFWINAAMRETLLTGFLEIAERLSLSERDEYDQTRLIFTVKTWFATHQEWLLILDNADDVVLVHDFVPPTNAGHLLLTSRAGAMGSLARQVCVETMGMAEGTLFVLRRARLIAASDAFLDSVSAEQLACAEAIVIEMDFLPLALDQAGAYIDEVGCSLAAYLELYRTHRTKLLQRRGHVPTDHPEPVATTWSLNFLQVEQANPTAADLLRFCAFLEPDAIPEEMMNEGRTIPGPALPPLIEDAFALNEALENLRKFSLIQRDPEARLLRIHRLVQIILKDAMTREEQCHWAQRVVCVTNAGFPETIEASTWIRCQRYLAQSQACSVLIQDYAITLDEAASLLFRTASYLRMHGLYEQAELLYKQTLHIREQTHEPDHLYIASTLNGLANLYREQGRYQLAEPLFQRALRIREQALGPAHPEVARLLNNLAVLSEEQGQYERAEQLSQRALHIREQTLGPDHPDVAGSLNNLAVLYKERGQYEQAEPLYERALRIWEETLGPNHPDVAGSLNNLAELYTEQEKYEQAEPLYERALRIWEETLGPNHPDVAEVLRGFAHLYSQQAKYEQAEPLYQRALGICERTLKPYHRLLADILCDVAAFQEARGNSQDAVTFYQRALVIYEQVFGSTHPRIGEMRARYSVLCQMLKQEEANRKDSRGTLSGGEM